MHKCTHNAAGGTIQRLKPGFAIVRTRSRKPVVPPENLPASSTVAIIVLPAGCPQTTAVRSGPPTPTGVQMLLRFRVECATGCLRASDEAETPDPNNYAGAVSRSAEILRRRTKRRVDSKKVVFVEVS